MMLDVVFNLMFILLRFRSTPKRLKSIFSFDKEHQVQAHAYAAGLVTSVSPGVLYNIFKTKATVW